MNPTSIEVTGSVKRPSPEASSNTNDNAKKEKTHDETDIKSVVTRLNRFLVNEKKFSKACPIFLKLLAEKNESGAVTADEVDSLFSAVESTVLSIEVMLAQSNYDTLLSLFKSLNECSSLFTEDQNSWIKRWRNLLDTIHKTTSDDSFVLQSVYKTIDTTILMWDKKSEKDYQGKELTYQGNLQIYIIEILQALLQRAVLDYQITPVFKSISLLNMHNESVFSPNRSLFEQLMTAYREKKEQKNRRHVITHFTEEDSRNRVNPLKLANSNPYLLYEC